MFSFERPLKFRDSGEDVVELQLILAGFSGTDWDGFFGQNTEKSVKQFQHHFMGLQNPSGIADFITLHALRDFNNTFQFDFDDLKCTCGLCGGFGYSKNQGVYLKGKPQVEAYYQYEYPGIHKAILYSYKACIFYAKRNNFPTPVINCGYRCSENNKQHGRTSTNHQGKALDIDFPAPKVTKEDVIADKSRCDAFRELMTKFGNFQIAWNTLNQKALEPSSIAPTWIHMDVRCYSQKFLQDKFFIKNPKDL